MPRRITGKGPLQSVKLRGKTIMLAAPGNSLAPAVIPIKSASGGGDASITGAGQIASVEAHGAPVLAATLQAAGIVGGEVLGAPQIEAAIAAANLVSGEVLGAHSVGAALAAAGIGSAEAFGAQIIAADIAVQGIASPESFGALDLQIVVAGFGVTLAEAFGQPVVSVPGDVWDILCAADVASGEAFGLPVLDFLPARSAPGIEIGRRAMRKKRRAETDRQARHRREAEFFMVGM